MSKKLTSLLIALSVAASAVTAMGAEIEDSMISGSNEVTLFDSGTKYGDYLYYEVNSEATAVTITSCDDSAIGEIVIPSEIEGLPVTSIGERAFVYCYELTSVVIPDSITSIGEYAFNGCHSLTSVTIPNGVTNINDWVFYECSSLTNITIPNGVTNIGDCAFYNCSELTSIIIPNSVTSIGEEAFSGCSSLTSVIIPDSVTKFGTWVFNSCFSLTNVIIPDSITEISSGTFANCQNLSNVSIPNSITNIGEFAFAGCRSLTDIVIPDSVTNIGNSAFDGCSSLTDVYYPGSEDQWNSISIAAYNDPLTSAAIHFNAITNPTEPETAAVTVSAPVLGEDGTSVVEVTVPALGNVYANGIVYGVSYSDSGVTDVSSTPLVNGGDTSLEVGADGAQTVRVFVWNDKMQPITTAFEAQLQPEI